MNLPLALPSGWRALAAAGAGLLSLGLVVDAVAAAPAASAAGGRVERSPLEWSLAMARSEMRRGGPDLSYGSGRRHGWDYTTGLFAQTLMKLGRQTGEEEFSKFGADYISGFITPEGKIEGYRLEDYNLDMITPGKAVLMLYLQTKEDRYRRAADLLRRQLEGQPRTSDGGFWHKQRYPYQMWLDGLYMAAPFYAQYGQVFDRPADIDDAVKQILLVDRHTYDPGKGLHKHAWDEKHQQGWADPETGQSPNFWGRAEGWYAMAIVDTLDFVPASQHDIEAVVGVLRRVADGIARWQDPESGLWWQVLDQGGRKGNYLEATASSMFVYALARGINEGYLPRETYEPVLKRGYAGLIDRLIRVDADGTVNLTQCCQVSGLGYTTRTGRPRDGSYEYYISEPVVENDLKGVAPFILAGMEIDRLAKKPPVFTHVRGWEDVDTILARIQPPTFPDRDFPITDYGAVADGKTDCTSAIGRAIEACHAAGGGRVLVQGGTFLTGAIHLKSNVNLHIARDATLKFDPDPAKYPVVFTRWEGVELMNFSALIYAFEQENIAVTGHGRLDGSASNENWWAWTRRNPDGSPSRARGSRDKLMAMGQEGVPVEQRVFGPGEYLRPNFIQPYRCRNVLIEDVTINRSPMWEVHPVLCTNVTVRGLTIESHGPNNDGCDPESCRDVLIENCLFDTGDDCIAIKSGRNNDGRRVNVPSENIIVRNCVMKDGHGGVVMGSEISGGCRNVFVENCQMDSPNLDRALRFKSNAVRGGVIENVFMRKVEIGRVAEAVLTVDFLYEEGAKGPYKPVVRNVQIEQVTSEASPRVMWIAGFDGAVIDDITFRDCTFKGIEESEVLSKAGTVVFDHVDIIPARARRSINSPSASSAASGSPAPTKVEF